MEFDSVFTTIQGRLNSIQKSINVKYVDISADHEEEITKIIDGLKEIITELELEPLNFKKIHLLFVLNSEFPNVTLFEEDRNFCHVIGALPKLSKYLYFKIVTNLKWHNYFGEWILNFPEVLTHEVLTSVSENLKYIDWDCALSFVYFVYESVFIKIMLLQNVCKSRTQKFVKIFFSIAKFKFQEVLKELRCPEIMKEQYMGYIVRMYLDLVHSCILQMSDPVFVRDNLYESTLVYDYTKWVCSDSNVNFKHYCLGVVTSKCVEAVKDVSVSMYMSWTEIDVNDAVGKSLQMSVREAAYLCRGTIMSVSRLYDSVLALKELEMALSSIAVRPITEDEEIQSADSNTIIMNLLNPKRTQVKWLRGLIDRGIFESPTHMKIVTANLSLIDFDTVLLLLNKAVQYITTTSVSQEDISTINRTIVLSVKALSQSNQILLLTRFCELFGNIEPLLTIEFEDQVTQLFNKLVNQDEREQQQQFCSEMVCLAIESRDVLVRRSFEECLSSKDKANLILNLISHVSQICLLICPESGKTLALTHVLALMETTKLATEKIKDNFVYLVESLCVQKILDANSFLFAQLSPMVQSCLDKKNWTDINFYLDLIVMLTLLVKPKSVEFVSVLAITLNKLRPKAQNFNFEAVEGTSKCITLLECCIENIIKTKTSVDDDILKLRALAVNLSPLTWQYMTPLWQNWGEDLPLDACGVLSWSQEGFGFNDFNTLSDELRLHLVTTTVKVLPQLMKSEWERIGKRKKRNSTIVIPTFQILADCVLVLFQVPFIVQNPNLLGNNVMNFMHYTKVNVIPHLKKSKEEDTYSVVCKLTQIMEQLPETLSSTTNVHLLHLKESIEQLNSNKPS